MSDENPASATTIAEPESAIAPVSAQERISSVDAVRGFSLLGILLMNIASFALPGQAYDDPSVAGGAAGLNLAVWAINYVLFEGKMRAIFSMLFGAGVVLLTARAEQRGAGVRIADIYYRRTLWLLAFGILHAYLFWVGDILYSYAVTGLMLFPLRKVSPKALIIAGLVLLFVLTPRQILDVRELRSLRDKAAAADTAAKTGKQLTEEQKKDKEAWQNRLKDIKPPADVIKKEIDAHRTSYWTAFLRRQSDVGGVQSAAYYRYIVWDVGGMMLLGMALLKLGFFSAQRSYREYALVAFLGYTLGIAHNCWICWRDISSNFDPIVMSTSYYTYQYERLALALAHVSVLMIVCKAGALTWLTSRLAAVGQMALTNYFTHTLVCTTVFDRLSFFGAWQRYQIYYVVLSICAFQLVASKIWLAHFRFGPVEWLWRSLTYWQRQPMRLVPGSASAGAATADVSAASAASSISPSASPQL